MKRTILILTTVLIGLSTFAQPDGPPIHEKKEKLDAMRAAFITEKLNLSAKEAQTFWPLYNEMDDKIHELTFSNREKMMKIHEDGGKETISDDDLNALLEERFDTEIEVAKIKKSYHKKFVEMLGVQKTADLYMAEMEFRRELMKRARGRGGDGNRGPGRER